jgi:ATP adenylyltransferase
MSESESCFFCKTLADPTSYNRIMDLETDTFMVIWDGFPVAPGHALVIPKRHVQLMADLNETERTGLIDHVLRVKEYLKTADLTAAYKRLASQAEGKSKAYIDDALAALAGYAQGSPDAFNDGLNDGPAAGQTVHHLHWHVMPRWNGDTDDPRGGIRHMFPGKGNYRV